MRRKKTTRKLTALLIGALLGALPACAVGEGTGLPQALSALFEGEAAYAGYVCTASDGETARGTPGELAVFAMDDGERRELFVARHGAEATPLRREARSPSGRESGRRAGSPSSA